MTGDVFGGTNYGADTSESGYERINNLYTCSKCKKTFLRTNGLRKHLVLQQRQNYKIACTVSECCSSFINKANLKKHLKNWHNDHGKTLRQRRKSPPTHRPPKSPTERRPPLINSVFVNTIKSSSTNQTEAHSLKRKSVRLNIGDKSTPSNRSATCPPLRKSTRLNVSDKSIATIRSVTRPPAPQPKSIRHNIGSQSSSQFQLNTLQLTAETTRLSDSPPIGTNYQIPVLRSTIEQFRNFPKYLKEQIELKNLDVFKIVKVFYNILTGH